jgi:hypothetical protein
MKQLFFCTLILCSFFLDAQPTAADFIVKDKVLVKYRGYDRDVVIPPRLGINRIGERAFAGTSIISVVIPMGVGYIDERAFMGCSFLKAITLPNTLITLGRRAFFNCYMLETINIPRSLVAIEDGVFYNCRSLKEMDIPDTLKKLGARAFSGCLGMEKISVSRRTELGQHVFMGVPCTINYKD